MKQIFFLTLLILGHFCLQANNPDSRMLTMLVGTYTRGSSVGVYTFRFNTGDLTCQLLSQTEADNPSYLTVSSGHDFVYAVSESAGRSAVNAYAFNKDTGSLRFLNQKQVESGPCYILYHEQTHTVVTANYNSGTVSIIQIAADGSLADRQITFAYEGQGIIPERQKSPHLHCIAATPDNKAIFATDLGTDKIHKIDVATPQSQTKDLNLTFTKSTSFELEPGSGPRHVIFNSKHTFAYLINELSGMVSVLSIEADNKLNLKQSILADTVHAGGSADIHLSPDEKYLYASTRLKGDGIVIFSVNEDGTLKRIGYHATGKHPRNFAITPDGNLMLVGCKDSGIIQIFNIDKQSGLLTDTGKTIPVDQPVCIKLIN